MEIDITELIMLYGRSIIESDIFQSGFDQPHHFIMTVADHSMDVTIASVRIMKLLKKMHIKMNAEDLIVASLCHDLGILGRDIKFKNNRECCGMHPKLSVEEARKLIPNLSKRMEKNISRHMFPLTPVPPTTREGIVLTLADKYAACGEILSWYFGKAFQEKMRRQLRERIIAEAVVSATVGGSGSRTKYKEQKLAA